ncbi:TonB-dependent receptor [Agriterribacter sp.]|uniref:SusC/RagA family TonB-linked outer membrane protein n=1 Tax=Agriterribacter sp. TaxID=2821509 RepID=UPI002B5F899D|nr:TonB-dependent receptor [Agriterribacter sp.]HRO47149.1 TonB-dependent receptor [Agriterribacter sp.]HRQ17901.1 TonB-dependent receptor [Agriterribacter sp.]
MGKDKYSKTSVILSTRKFFIRRILFLAFLICLKVSVNAQDITVSGTVTANTSGEPLTGVSVKIKGTAIGVSTDKNGQFSIKTPQNGILVITHVGYETLDIPVNNRETIDISLTSTSTSLDEVLVVGYGTQKKVNLTGAVDVISNKKIENRQSPTVSQILQGQSPGLDFSLGDNGLEPGASMKINIRGMGSVNGGSPYVVIDGFPGEMDRLNPNDIESISVLKDAAASAIYGARAPFGVILITTKSGKRNEKLSIAYAGNMSVNSTARLPKMLDSYTFARVINEFGVNGGGRTYSNAAIDRIIAYQNEDWEYLKQFYPAGATYYESMPLANGTWGNNQDAHANYDWYDEYYGNSLNQQHNLSVKGGSNKLTYYFSSGFTGQNGVINYGTDSYKRYNIAGKVKAAITDWMDIRYETRFMKSVREFPSMPVGMPYNYMFFHVMRTVPTQAKYNGFGTYSIQSKIPFVEDAGTSEHTTTENWHILATELRPAKGWKIYGEFAYQSTGIVESDRQLAVYTNLVDGSLSPFAGSLPSSITQSHHNLSYWTTNIYTSYDLNVGKHNMLLMAGTQFELNQINQLTASKTNLIVQSVPSLETANGSLSAGENLEHWATQGYFGRITYNFNEKYLFEANARYDGTSRFKKENRWGFFPSFSLGWNVNKEDFWKGMANVVNTFKLRGSWGQLGNQQVASYQDLALIPLQSGQLNWLFNYGAARPLGYTSTPSLVSPDLTWETATTKNIGLNTGFLNNRLQLDFDVFERVTKNMIGPSEPLPGILGASVPKSNNATLRTRGWEGAIRWNSEIKRSGLSYFVSFNMADAQSVVLDYLNPTGIVTDWYAGKKVGEIWGYTANELFRSQEDVNSYLSRTDLSFIYNTWNPGDLKYLDTNGDGKVNNGTNSINNPGDISVIGNNTPRYQYGLSAGFEYKGFDFSFLIKGTGKRDYFVTSNTTVSNYAYWGINTWLHTGLTTEHLDYFRDKPGDEYTGLYEGDANINLDAFWPKMYIQADQNHKNRQPSSRYLLDLSYARLQNVQLGYNLPQSLLKKLRIQKVRMYISGENLLTITNAIKPIDPVALGTSFTLGATYRTDKMVSFGINITL